MLLLALLVEIWFKPMLLIQKPEPVVREIATENPKEWNHSRHLASTVPQSAEKFSTLEITEDGLSLSLLSQLVYGTSKRWPEIAQLNHLKAPFRIRVGQKLKLRGQFHLNRHELSHKILNLWRNKLERRLISKPAPW